MHAAALHSALAIRRQRKQRKDLKLANERRASVQSTQSGITSPRNSVISLDTRKKKGASTTHGSIRDSKVVSSIGMLHIGVVFLVLGFFLLGAGIIPVDYTTMTVPKLWNELILTGGFSAGLGIFLIVLHVVISRSEENDLKRYVENQLTRSRSGHRLERDAETGGHTTKHYRKCQQKMKEDLERGLNDVSPTEEMPGVHNSPPPLYTDYDINGGTYLAKIMEEDSEKGEEDTRKMDLFDAYLKESMSPTTTMSFSPGSAMETQGLLINSSGKYVASHDV